MITRARDLKFDADRVSDLLERLERLIAHDRDTKLAISPAHDELDAIAFGINALAEELRWAKAVQPLLEFCRHPYRSADRLAVRTYPALNWDLVPKAWRSLHTRGLMGFLHDVRVYLNVR